MRAIPSLAQGKKITLLIKTSHGYFTLSYIMSSWQPASSFTPSGWGKTGKTSSEVWRNWKTANPHAPFSTLMIPKRPANTLMEYLPTKGINLKKGTLFDLLNLDIINDIVILG